MSSSNKKTYTIYQLSDGRFKYVGLTTQGLGARLRQHKHDAKAETCSVTAKLCQKDVPKDLKALHRRLRDHGANFQITKLKELTGTYQQAHREELKLKKKHATL